MDYPGKVITKTQVTPTQTSASGNWTLDDQAAAIKNNNWPVALVPNPISKSLRFNSADSTYLNRTPASAGNRQKFTWSGWVKRTNLSSNFGIFAASDGTSNNEFLLYFAPGDTIYIQQTVGGTTSGQINCVTNAVFRDPSAWYHIVLSIDTTQATSTNRLLVYVNNVSQSFSSYSVGSSINTWINNTNAHAIGRRGDNSLYLSAYLTEINFIDGQALTPSSFGMTNPQTGQWIPIKYSGTYGTNGFYLNFKDATSTTTLGYDYSGNANNWTTNNFSVTAGSGNDSLTDVPTPWVAYNTTGDVGGVVRGNYATLNPLYPSGGTRTFANGNLEVTGGALNANSTELANWQLTTGKWYFEGTVGAIGLASITQIGTSVATYYGNGTFFPSGSGASYTTNDVIGVAADIDAGTVQFYKNGVSQGTVTGTAGTASFPAFALGGNATPPKWIVNFGQRPFAYTPPAGFRSLCTTNLPATTIGFGLTNQGDDYFNTVLYTGNGSTNNITGVGFQPDFVWLKDRTTAFNNYLYDAVRGTTKALQSNSTNAEETRTGLTAFGSDGFTLGSQGGDNQSSDSFVAWNWKASGSTVSNTAGTITSTVSANTTSGFSIATYTGTGVNATVGHGLGVAPSMVIVKSRTGGTSSWAVWFTGFSGTEYILLESTAAKASAASVWNSTVPNSTVVSIGTGSVPNTNGWTYVMYCFAAVAGYSAFGSYTGNNSADGPFVYTGFRPAFVLIKATNTTQWWTLLDNKRDTYNVATLGLSPNSSDSETTFNTNRGPHNIDFTSNGFKIRTSSSGINGTNTFIYACFAESPFQFANAR